ncbi:hypothetical protein GE09DRAFT_1221496 [Coniochaeta sp. 2T2.1]|nr:hypothetical protein GE09DRAFT_1221496 [Coniochaeta sp. 2T2.1]
MSTTPSLPPPSAPHQRALESLTAAVGILDLFAHRNRNQHRLSKWWAPFDMLRRNARKAIPDVEACVESRTKIAALEAKKKKGKVIASAREKDEELRKKMEGRARWLGAEIVPRAYLAFTQLAADNQYAHLGLGLVGVLAQVNAAVEMLVPPEETDGDAAVTAAGKTVTGKGITDATDVPDMGVAISRGEIGQRGSSKQVETQRSKPAVESHYSPKPGKTKGESVSSEKQRSTTTSGTVKEAPKRLKNRDEFDSLFDLLETKPAKKKKKRKTDGDEFDNLFSSLV